MKNRRHHNNTGEHQVRTGKTRGQVSAIAARIEADRAAADRREEAVRELVEKAEALAARLDEVREATSGIFTMAHVHGMIYSGPAYGVQLEELRAASAAVRELEPK